MNSKLSIVQFIVEKSNLLIGSWDKLQRQHSFAAEEENVPAFCYFHPSYFSSVVVHPTSGEDFCPKHFDHQSYIFSFDFTFLAHCCHGSALYRLSALDLNASKTIYLIYIRLWLNYCNAHHEAVKGMYTETKTNIKIPIFVCKITGKQKKQASNVQTDNRHDSFQKSFFFSLVFLFLWIFQFVAAAFFSRSRERKKIHSIGILTTFSACIQAIQKMCLSVLYDYVRSQSERKRKTTSLVVVAAAIADGIHIHFSVVFSRKYFYSKLLCMHHMCVLVLYVKHSAKLQNTLQNEW